MARGDDWDTPGGPGGREVIERRRGPTPGAARALYHQWLEAVDRIADGRVFKATVAPAVFNTFRRARLDSGLTDEQLAESFKNFATAVTHGPVSVRHNDLWRAYAASWARWVPAAVREPLEGSERSPGWQR